MKQNSVRDDQHHKVIFRRPETTEFYGSITSNEIRSQGLYNVRVARQWYSDYHLNIVTVYFHAELLQGGWQGRILREDGRE